MSKLGRPRGLIDYESWNNIERGRRNEAAGVPAGAPEDRRSDGGMPVVDRLRSPCYLWTMTNASLSVQHDRDPLTIRLSDGSVRNAYTVKILNKSS